MANSAEYDVIINVITGHLQKATKELKDMASSVDGVAASQNRAARAGRANNDVINGGVASANNGTRGFAKLKESINGSNGLVAAYATLATNAFAVGAAFTALQKAAQVEQVFKGLQEQGIRTGVTLTTTAQNMQRLTDYSINAADAMTAVAQVSAAGFSTKTSEDLAKAAANSAAALGRNIPDALDRFIKGTTKLEPELLDEMGIMVKLDEASSKYAQSLGKLPSQLTSTEKRTAYLNAVLAESDRKFKGMADAAEPNPYNQLAAAFTNLTTTTLNFVNNNGAETFVKSLANNTELLTATLVLFGSTIVKQIIPGLYGMAASAAVSAEALAKQAVAQHEAVLEAEKEAAATRELALEHARTLNVVQQNSAAYKNYATALKDGTATEAQKTTVLRGLASQIGRLEAANTRLNNVQNKTQDILDDIETRKALIKTYKDQQAVILNLATAEAAAQRGTEAAQAAIASAKAKEKVAGKKSEAQSSFAEGLQKAGSGDILGAFGSIKEGLGSLQESYRAAGATNDSFTTKAKLGFTKVTGSIMGATSAVFQFIAGTGSVGRLETIINGIAGTWFRLQATIAASGGIINTVKLAFTGLTMSIKAVGTAVLSAIPIIGQLFFAFELIMEYGPKVWEAIKSLFMTDKEKKAAEDRKKLQENYESATKKVEDAQKSLNESLKTSEEVAKRYAKTLTSFTVDTAAQKAGIIATSNSFKELADSLKKLHDEQENQIAAKKAMEDGKSALDNFAKSSNLNIDSLKSNAELYNVIVKMYSQGSNQIRKSIEDIARSKKGPQEVQKAFYELTQNVGKNAQDTVDSVTGLSDSFNALDKEAQAFAKGLVQSTSYDSFIEKLQDTNKQVAALKDNFSKTQDVKAFSQQLQSVVDTSAIRGLIGPEANKELSEYTARTQILTELTDRANKGDKIAKELSIKYQKDIEGRTVQMGETLQVALQTRENELLNLQSQERTIQSTIAIENSRYKAFQRFAGQTAESARAADAHEQKLQDLEKSKLKLLLSQIDVQIQGILAKKTELEIQKKLHEEIKKTYDDDRKGRLDQLKSTVEAAKAIPKPVYKKEYGGGGSSGRAYEAEYKRQRAEYDSRQAAAKEAQKQVDLLTAAQQSESQSIDTATKQWDTFEESVRSATKSLRDSQKSITDSMEAISAGNMTEAEKKARDLGLSLKIVQDTVITISEHQSVLNGILDKQNSLLDKQYPSIIKTSAASKDQLNRSISVLEIERSTARLALQTRISQLKSAATNTALTKEERASNAAELSVVTEQLKIFDKITEAKRSDLIITNQIQLLEAASINPLKEGLEIQQKSLEIINAQFDAQQKLVDSTAEGRKLDAQIAAKKLGKELDPELQKEMEVTAAKESLKLAEDQLQAKIEGIKLEYALLEAQKISTIIELSMQKKILETKLKASQNGGLTEDQQIMLNQITQSVNELGKYSYDAVRDIAIATAKSDVENKRKTVELLSASSALGDASDNLLNNVLFSIDTAKRLQKERDIGDTASSNTVASGVFASIKDSVIPDMSKVLDTGLQKVEDTSSTISDIFNRTVVDLTASMTDTGSQFNTITNDMKNLHDVLKTISPEVASYMKKAEQTISSATPSSATTREAIKIPKVIDRPSDIKMSKNAWGGPVAKPIVDLVRFIQSKLPNAIATSFNAGKHNAGSTHLDGLKVDITGAITTKEIQRVVDEYTKLTGYRFKVTDEHTRPKGQKVWDGSHNDIKLLGVASPTLVQSAKTQSDTQSEPTHKQVWDEKTHKQVWDEKTRAPNNGGIFGNLPDSSGSGDLITQFDQAMAGVKDIRDNVNKGTEVDIKKLLQNIGYQKVGAGTDITKPEDTAGFSKSGTDKLNAFKADVTKQAEDLQKSLYDKIFGDGKLGKMSAEEAKKATEAFQKEYADKIGPIAQDAYDKAFPASGLADKVGAFWDAADARTKPFLDNLKKLGPQGELVVSVYQGVETITKGITDFAKDVEQHGLSLKNVADLASGILSTIMSVTAAASNAKIAGVDKEIAAEEKRDGKSAASVARIDALEKKKDAIAKKAFNTNKKLMMAQAVMSTAAGIANALGQPGHPIQNMIMAGIIGAMGAAQLAIIASTQYESTYKPSFSTPSTLSIGKRGDTVDLAKGPNANAGGEVSYLRGSSGTGTNASNYRTVGSAYGGELMRGYGNRGFVVGEKGPEVITPETPITVTPANDVGGAAPINASISIHALDSSGVQDILVSQKGNIIKMLREAANASGKTFMEDVNVNVYTRPSVGKL